MTRVLDSQCGAFVAELGVPCVKPASPKFVQSLTQIRPGHYVAKLQINAIDVSDFGQYTCKVRQEVGMVIFVTLFRPFCFADSKLLSRKF